MENHFRRGFNFLRIFILGQVVEIIPCCDLIRYMGKCRTERF